MNSKDNKDSKVLEEAALNGFEVQIMHDPSQYIEVNVLQASHDNTKLSDTNNWDWRLRDFRANEVRYSTVGYIKGQLLSKDNLTAKEVISVFKDWNKKQAAFKAKLKDAAEFLLEAFKLDYGNAEAYWDEDFGLETYILHLKAEAPNNSYVELDIPAEELVTQNSFRDAFNHLWNVFSRELLSGEVKDECDQVHSIAEMTQPGLKPGDSDYSVELAQYASDCDFFNDRSTEIYDAHVKMLRPELKLGDDDYEAKLEQTVKDVEAYLHKN